LLKIGTDARTLETTVWPAPIWGLHTMRTTANADADAFHYQGAVFDYTPYPMGGFRPALDETFYAELVESFPPLELFEYKAEKGEKYALSQTSNARQYRRFLRASAPWRRFHRYVKSPAFIDRTLEMLRHNGVDLGLPSPRFWRRQYLKLRALRRGNPVPRFPRLKARFEFSAMPATGGSIRPHTDHPRKLVTLVFAMPGPEGWDQAWGGGTSVVWPKDESRVFNRVNDYLDFDEVDRVRTVAFQANQCLVFVRTDTSWHAVWPMQGDDPRQLRRTVTVNIESD
jgi:hypothetical protein